MYKTDRQSPGIPSCLMLRVMGAKLSVTAQAVSAEALKVQLGFFAEDSVQQRLRWKSPTSLGICGLVGRATTFVWGDVGSIPTCGALEVWQWTFGSRTVWLVNESAGQPQFKGDDHPRTFERLRCDRLDYRGWI
jgi:hypothetical protein